MSITVYNCAECNLPLPKIEYRRPRRGKIGYRPGSWKALFWEYKYTEPLCEPCWKKAKADLTKEGG